MKFRPRATALPPMRDEEIIELYWLRDETAITETDRKYKSYLLTVAYNIVHDSLDCEECLNDTYIGAWNAMPPSRPRVLKAFLTTIMRRIAINRYHVNTRKKSIPSELSVSLSELGEWIADDSDSVSAEFDARRLAAVISEYIRALPERRKFIFMSRYYLAEPIDSIARGLGLSRSMINKELAAIRSGLKEKLESEGYTV